MRPCPLLVPNVVEAVLVVHLPNWKLRLRCHCEFALIRVHVFVWCQVSLHYVVHVILELHLTLVLIVRNPLKLSPVLDHKARVIAYFSVQLTIRVEA